MENKDLIPNTTQFPNIIIDFVIPQIQEPEARCMIYIVRRTFGFHKEEDRISLTQFINGITARDGRKADLGTRLSRPSVVKALKNLEASEAIFRVKDSKGDFYRINLGMDPDKVVNEINRLTALTKSGKPRLPISVNRVNPQKKEKPRETKNTCASRQEALFIRSEHQQFMDFFYETCQKTRSFKPIIKAADGANLKRVLDSKILSFTELQQLTLYFLAHSYYKKFAPAISTFLSSGILNGLLNASRNKPEFWKELDGYTQTYLKTPAVKESDFSDRLAKLAEMKNNLIKTKTFRR